MGPAFSRGSSSLGDACVGGDARGEGEGIGLRQQADVARGRHVSLRDAVRGVFVFQRARQRTAPARRPHRDRRRKRRRPRRFPRVDPETQKGRDGVRRKVLADELAAEEKLLAETRIAYADGAPRAAARGARGRREISRAHRAAAAGGERAREEHRGAEEGARRRQVTARALRLGDSVRARILLACSLRSRGGTHAFGDGACHDRRLEALSLARRRRRRPGVRRLRIAGDCRADARPRAARDLRQSRGGEPVRAREEASRRPSAGPGVHRCRGSHRGHRQGGPRRRDVHRAGARAHGRRQVEAPSHVHGVAGRNARSRAAARVPAHRPAAEDRARRAIERAAAGEPRVDPQSRARDQESARRHSRRRAAPRARARPAAADRVHAGRDRRGRPPAVARQSAADAAPAADVPAHEHPRDRVARAEPRAGGVSARRRGLRFRHQPAGVRRRSGAAHAGDAQHRPQRGAGARSDALRIRGSASRRASRAT